MWIWKRRDGSCIDVKKRWGFSIIVHSDCWERFIGMSGRTCLLRRKSRARIGTMLHTYKLKLKLNMGIYSTQTNPRPNSKMSAAFAVRAELFAPSPPVSLMPCGSLFITFHHHRCLMSIASLSPINTLPPSPSISPSPSLRFGSSMPLSIPSSCCCSEVSSSPGASARSSSSSEA